MASLPRISSAADNAVADSLDDEDFMFGDMFDDVAPDAGLEAPADDTVLAEGQDDATQTDELPDPTPQPATPSAVPVPAPAAAQPAPAPAAAPAPAPQVPTSSAPSAAEMPKFHDLVASKHDEFVAHLAATAFALKPDEAALFDDPGVAQFVAQRDAKMYLHIMSAVSKVLDTAVPQVIRNVVSNDTVAGRHENDFYTRYPELNQPQYTEGLKQLARTLRQTHPTLTADQLMTSLGRTAQAMYGVQPTTTPAGVVPRAKAAPFVPGARAGGVTQTKPAGATVVSSDPLLVMNNALMADLE